MRGVEDPRSRQTDGALPLYAIFALTGVGTALLGATLPVMLVRWRLNDADAGALFLLLFVASSSGALVRRHNSAAVAAGGSGLLALCCIALALTHGWAVFPETAAFGFGLGFCISTVTRVRLLCPPEQRVREVNRLNLVWGLGAFLCPTVANEAIRAGGVRGLFFGLAAIFGVVCVWTSSASGRTKAEAFRGLTPESRGRLPLPWMAAAGAFLAVGLESSMGAWLAAYAHRLESGFAAPVEATTLFWLGLLASRAACSTKWVRPTMQRRLLLGLLALTAVGCIVLVGFRGGEAVLVAALLIGLGVGPVFPILLAAVLPRVRGNVIFVIGGVGASVLPWLTGVVSGRAGSLRSGLLVDAFAAGLLLAMSVKLASVLESLNPALQAEPGWPPEQERH